MRTPSLTSSPRGATLRGRRSGRSSNRCWAGWVVCFTVASVPMPRHCCALECWVDFYLRFSAGPHGRPEIGALQEPVPSHHGPDDDSGWVWRQNDEKGHGGSSEPLPYTFPNTIGNSGAVSAPKTSQILSLSRLKCYYVLLTLKVWDVFSSGRAKVWNSVSALLIQESAKVDAQFRGRMSRCSKVEQLEQQKRVIHKNSQRSTHEKMLHSKHSAFAVKVFFY